MQWFEVFCITLLLVYTIFIVWNILVLRGQKKEEVDLRAYNPTTTVSIIIPARNEEQNILTCLHGIILQIFPKDLLQVIVVDDDSSDNTMAVAEEFLSGNFKHYKLLKSGGQGKKAALLTGIEQATGKIIITRDADTNVYFALWLKSIVYSFEKSGCDLLIMPVVLSANSSFLSTFQQFENLAITSLGAGMAKSKLPFVCSGANLAYKKECFTQIEPYKDNLSVASGDDMFLLKHFYLSKQAIEANISAYASVYTPAEGSLKKMLAQRLRWASKTGKINTFPVFFIGLLVLFVNTLCLPILCLGFINAHYWHFSLFTLTLKFIIDFLLLFLSARMYQQKVKWRWFPLAFLFNGVYVPVIALSSFFIKPDWKLRSF